MTERNSNELHKHHLKPKHLGGTDDPSNLLEVTVDEHALIHEARWYAYRQWQDKVAWLALSKQIGKEEIQKEVARHAGYSRKGKSWKHVGKSYEEIYGKEEAEKRKLKLKKPKSNTEKMGRYVRTEETNKKTCHPGNQYAKKKE